MELLSYKEALEILLSQSQPFGVETLDIDNSLNRVLVEDVFADRDYPPFNRAAMDGIAVAFKDIENGISQFSIIETIYAGQSSNLVLKPNQCFKIMTGAAVPLCADVVIRIEDIKLNQQIASTLANNVNHFQNIAIKGQDLKNNELAVSKNTKISPSIIGLLASVGKRIIKVNKMPIVAIITTGGEVKDINDEVSMVQIRNSNQHLIKALLKQNNIESVICQHIIDDEHLLLEGIKEYLNVDILIICGGVSAGDADYVPAVLNTLGVKKLFHKVAIKPGKPIWCGKKQNGAMVFALPGNPFSCLVTFKIFIEPYINNAVGLPKMVNKTLSLNHPRTQKTKFDEFFPIVIDDENKNLSSVAINGSGDIRLGLQANGLALHSKSMGDISKNQSLNYWNL